MTEPAEDLLALKADVRIAQAQARALMGMMKVLLKKMGDAGLEVPRFSDLTRAAVSDWKERDAEAMRIAALDAEIIADVSSVSGLGDRSPLLRNRMEARDKLIESIRREDHIASPHHDPSTSS